MKRIVLLALFLACDKSSTSAQSSPAEAAAGPNVRPAYAAFDPSVRKADPKTLPLGDITLAKGRKVAPIERQVKIAWASSDKASMERNASPALDRVRHALESPRSPACPDVDACAKAPWFAADPKTAGVVLLVDRLVAQVGTYKSLGSDTPHGSGYEALYVFDAVAVPENVRVAHWTHYELPPQQVVDPMGLMHFGELKEATLEKDVSSLTSGVAPQGDGIEPK